jgi:hypothetical protein
MIPPFPSTDGNELDEDVLNLKELDEILEMSIGKEEDAILLVST